MTDVQDTSAELRQRVEKQRFMMLTSADESGALESRPMTVQRFDGWSLWFITQRGNDVAQQSDGSYVNLSAMDGGIQISLSGTGRLSSDVDEKRDLWNRLNEAYAGDAEDPENVILVVDVDRGAYWDSGNAIARVAGLAKAAVSGEPPEGEHGEASV